MRNEVNCIRLASTNSTYYYILDDEYNLIVCDKRPITNIRERGNNDESNGFTKRFDTRLKSLRSKGRSDKSHNISFDDRKTTERNVRLSDREIQSKRNSNGAGYYENGNNADLREEKSSKTVNDNINDLKRENKKLKEANELLRHEFELTGGLKTSISSATNIGSYDTIYDKSNLTKKTWCKKHQVF
ncbi:MAG: hypothetical protein PUE75_08075 [Eubacteriales bacterium]|nr:hypothetical protein [Eubacteriales bacterium]